MDPITGIFNHNLETFDYTFYVIKNIDEFIPQCYYGSTRNLVARIQRHKSSVNNTIKIDNSKKATFMRNLGWDSWVFHTLYTTHCTKIEAVQIERSFIQGDENATLNTELQTPQLLYRDPKMTCMEHAAAYAAVYKRIY